VALAGLKRLIKSAAQQDILSKLLAAIGGYVIMKAQSTGPILSAVFVDYDNIYLSLKRKSEDAAKRFAKDAPLWLNELVSGKLVTSNQASENALERRIVMNRCYGNPIPRRNSHDNSTDMNSFPFVRHHFLRSGFEVIDCPPLTAQLKNSADIRMVMDVRDLLNHDTYFDEFVILSSDADFTPVLHRLRAHARRNIIFTNDHTASPYTAICDGEVRETDLMTLLLEGNLAPQSERQVSDRRAYLPSSAQLETVRKSIIDEVVAAVKAAGRPVPLEALADRAVRALGHEKTAGSQWAGAGGFRDLLTDALPEELSVSSQPPYFVYDSSRQLAQATSPAVQEPATTTAPAAQGHREPSLPVGQTDTRYQQHQTQAPQQPAAHDLHGFQPNFDRADNHHRPEAPAAAPAAYHDMRRMDPVPHAPQPQPQQQPTPEFGPAATAHEAAPQAGGQSSQHTAIQQSIARIHDASQAPPLSPPEYRALFSEMAEEIRVNNLSGTQTLDNIVRRCKASGTEVRRDDVRFVLQVVSEPDPWFEQGASASLFASRFRNFVVARCRSQGLALSVSELDLIEAWFGNSAESAAANAALPAETTTTQPQNQQPRQSDPWWDAEEERQHRAQEQQQRDHSGFAFHDEQAAAGDDFPRIVRSRLRG
jgi:NYN domain